MKHALLAGATALLASLSLPAAAKDPPRPAVTKPSPEPARPAAAEEAMPGVDPAVLAQCRTEADGKRLRGEDRATFLKSCTEPED
ncbi:hypothetical protein [Methylobacterium sp. ID0610]|uniref:hypothetical protein n=1 Tax=Methylobacterium carpenticola TaxID=3344827 RepID=UPI0036B6546F